MSWSTSSGQLTKYHGCIGNKLRQKSLCQGAWGMGRGNTIKVTSWVFLDIEFFKLPSTIYRT